MSIRRSLRTLACVLALAPCLSCGRETGAAMTNEPQATSSLQLHSPDFRADGALPARFTCDGDSVSPALQRKAAGTRGRA